VAVYNLGIKVYFNDKLINIKSVNDYIKMHLKDTPDLFVEKLSEFGKVKVVQSTKNIFITKINDIKVDFVNYKYPLLEDIKTIVKDTSNSVENLHVLQSYLNVLNDWSILLEEANKSFAVGNPQTTKKIGEVKLKISQVENYISKNDESGVVETLQKILIPASNDMIKILKEKYQIK
jgi:hypothetical protein